MTAFISCSRSTAPFQFSIYMCKSMKSLYVLLCALIFRLNLLCWVEGEIAGGTPMTPLMGWAIGRALRWVRWRSKYKVNVHYPKGWVSLLLAFLLPHLHTYIHIHTSVQMTPSNVVGLSCISVGTGAGGTISMLGMVNNIFCIDYLLMFLYLWWSMWY